MTSRLIALIDDQPEVLQALGDLLAAFGYEIARFPDAISFLTTPPATPAACIVCDVRMPDLDGISFMHKLTEQRHPAPVILISGHADVPMAVDAIKAGAFDFIEKPVDDRKLVAAINRALTQQAELANKDQPERDIAQRFEKLTPREAEVFDMVASGLTSHAIASELGISVRTVESYRAQIMEKMQASGVATLVRQAIRIGRLQP
ncbi:MAG: response regulator [Alphaproteobacteria bacterium]|nr:response regulator [Alphaproteobacteria bacterium]